MVAPIFKPPSGQQAYHYQNNNTQQLIMKYKGIYHDFNLPRKGKLLATYVDNIDIHIRYDEEQPFRITQIAILLEDSEQMKLYDVFECDYYAETDVEARTFAKSFAALILKYRKGYDEYLKGLKYRRPQK